MLWQHVVSGAVAMPRFYLRMRSDEVTKQALNIQKEPKRFTAKPCSANRLEQFIFISLLFLNYRINYVTFNQCNHLREQVVLKRRCCLSLHAKISKITVIKSKKKDDVIMIIIPELHFICPGLIICTSWNSVGDPLKRKQTVWFKKVQSL